MIYKFLSNPNSELLKPGPSILFITLFNALKASNHSLKKDIGHSNCLFNRFISEQRHLFCEYYNYLISYILKREDLFVCLFVRID